MKKNLFFIFILIAGNFCFAQINQQIINDAASFREALYCAGDETKINEIIQEYENSISLKNSNEELNFQKSVLLLEKANFLQTEENKKEFYYEFFKQNDINQDIIQNNKCSATFYAISADIISRLINFTTGGELLKLSSRAKDYYLKAKKSDRKNFYALLGYGLWLYFAPAIAGGGFDSAIKELTAAINNANTDFDKYIAYIYRSQIYFKLGKIKNYEDDLKNAKTVLPEETVIDYIREKNKNGELFFE